jgi:hypothetical protein
MPKLFNTNHTHNSFVRPYFQVDNPFIISSRNVLIGVGLNADSMLVTSMNNTDDDDANSCVSRVPRWKRPENGRPACTGKGCCEAASSRVLGHVASSGPQAGFEMTPAPSACWWRRVGTSSPWGTPTATRPASSRRAFLWFWTSPSGEARAHQHKASYAIATASGHLMAMVMAATVPKGMKATLTYATDAKVQLN